MPVPPTEITASDWIADLEHMKLALPGIHPNLFFHLPQEQFENRLDNLAERTSDLSYSQIIMALRELVAALGDPHTNLGFYELIEAVGAYPIQLYQFSDGLYVVGADERNSDLLGAKILAIDGRDIAEVIRRVSAIVPPNEPHFAAKRLQYFLRFHLILQHYGITQGELATFEFRAEGGDALVRDLKPNHSESTKAVWYTPKEQPLYWTRPRLPEPGLAFWDRYIPADDIYFVQYNQCWGREVEERYGSSDAAKDLLSFADFANRVVATLESHAPKLIFDLRFNGGGSSPQGTALVERIAQIDSVNRAGRLFVGISHETFSSAVINAMDFRLKTQATLLGRPAGGKPNHYGEVRTFVLPKTQVELYHSTKYFQYIDEDVEAVMPDIHLDNPFYALSSGVDPIYEHVKASSRS